GVCLYANDVGDAGLAALLAAPWMPRVRELNLNSTGITDVGARALAGCAALSRLRVLEVNYNREITNAGANALADSPHLGRLLRLGLDGVRCDRVARARLRERFGTALVL